MSACAVCLAQSLVQNESLGGADRKLLGTTQARKILVTPAQRLTDDLFERSPTAKERITRRVEEIAEDLPRDIGLWSICRHSGDFPERLAVLTEAPLVVYGLGRRELVVTLSREDEERGVAIVGARRASGYGREVAYRMGGDLAAAGVAVVSGMALGIDGAAHRGALRGSGKTIAVLAGGPDRVYPPSHRELHRQIVEYGAVVSERPPGALSRRWGFPARNRLIAAFADLTVIVEGTLSSGARHTIDFAHELGQNPVAVPGPVTSPLSDAPNHLLHEGAPPVRDARDVLDIICGAGGNPRLPGFNDQPAKVVKPPPKPPPEPSLEHPLGDVLRCVRAGDSTLQSIAEGLPELTAREIAGSLGELELKGLVGRDARGGFCPAGSVARGRRA